MKSDGPPGPCRAERADVVFVRDLDGVVGFDRKRTRVLHHRRRRVVVGETKSNGRLESSDKGTCPATRLIRVAQLSLVP